MNEVDTKTYERINYLNGEINALKQLLAASDYKALKHADGALSDEEYSETLELRKSYRKKINEYEEELKTLDVN